MKHLDDSTDHPAHAIGFLLKALQHSLRQAMDESLRRQGIDLSFAHFATLFGVGCEPGINGAVLARRAMVSPQTMNAVLRRLERDGQIERRRNPDNRRADSWHLTAAGEAQLDRARAVGDEVFTRMLSALGANDSRKLLEYLRRCVKALEGSTD